jgi:hypothetical protein
MGMWVLAILCRGCVEVKACMSKLESIRDILDPLTDKPDYKTSC